MVGGASFYAYLMAAHAYGTFDKLRQHFEAKPSQARRSAVTMSGLSRRLPRRRAVSTPRQPQSSVYTAHSNVRAHGVILSRFRMCFAEMFSSKKKGKEMT